MTELTPEIQTKLLERAKKNIQWHKKLEAALSQMEESDPKKAKVKKLSDTLKVQALLIVKHLKDLEGKESGEEDQGLQTNATEINTIRRDPTRSNPPQQVKAQNTGGQQM